jgi:hypothetical protein
MSKGLPRHFLIKWSLLQIASENQKSAIAAVVDFKSGVSGNEILELIKTVNERKVNGHSSSLN